MTQADQAAPSTEELKENLYHYLTGYGRGCPENLQQIIAFRAWRRRARQELDRRITELAERLTTEILIEIAEGRVDITEVARRVLETP